MNIFNKTTISGKKNALAMQNVDKSRISRGVIQRVS